MAEKESKQIRKNLEELNKIIEWFDAQDELDVEEALIKIKKATELIHSGKKGLVDIENDFREIKKKIDAEE